MRSCPSDPEEGEGVGEGLPLTRLVREGGGGGEVRGQQSPFRIYEDVLPMVCIN